MTWSPSLRSEPACRCPRSTSWTIRSPTPSRPAAIPQNAAVAATTGLLDGLSRDEIAGVMAHELAHVKNRDTLTMTVTATIAGAISMLANFGFFFGGARPQQSARRRSARSLMMILAPLAAMLVQMAISRTREYAADRGGAEISGQPLALASALGKISQARRIASRTTRPRPIRRPRISSSSIRCRARAWTICSRPIPRPRTGSPRSKRSRGEMGGRARRPRAADAGPWARPAGRARPMGLAARSDAKPGEEARRAAVRILTAVLGASRVSMMSSSAPRLRARWRATALSPMRSLRQACAARARAMPLSALFSPSGCRARQVRRDHPADGAAQLLFIEVPAHAAIDLAVTLAQR